MSVIKRKHGESIFLATIDPVSALMGFLPSHSIDDIMLVKHLVVEDVTDVVLGHGLTIQQGVVAVKQP